MSLHFDEINDHYDAVICGAGLAGLTLARQIRKEIPEISLLLLEGTGDKSTTPAIKVGESTIEVSAHYLADVLDLRQYLEKTHYRKMGFRFFFGSGKDPFQDRPELGTSTLSPLPSYQIERALLEKDLKQLNAVVGVHMLPDCKAEDFILGHGNNLHSITILNPSTNQRKTVRSRWIVDAAGRRRFLQNKLGIAEPKNPYYSAAWFRLEGRIDVCDLVPPEEKEWHNRVPLRGRYYSTNHLMGDGRWVWLIPLAPHSTSIGIVTHEEFFPFSQYNTYERALLWLEKHEPQLRQLIGTRQPVDFQCLRHYSYSARQVFSMQRWACTGDASVFSDPFLSPGIDQIGFANTIITELLKRDQVKQLSGETVEELNEIYLSFQKSLLWITHPAYAFFGDSVVMAAKLLWEIVRGFALNGPQRFNRIYLDKQKTAVLHATLSRLFLLTLRMEKLFKDWTSLTRRKYIHSYQFINYLSLPGLKELYLRNLQTNKSLTDLVHDHRMTLDYLEELVQLIFLLALVDTMPEVLSQLPSPLWLNAWAVSLNPERWKSDKLFSPTSPPRPLNIAYFASLFGMGDLPVLLSQK